MPLNLSDCFTSIFYFKLINWTSMFFISFWWALVLSWMYPESLFNLFLCSVSLSYLNLCGPVDCSLPGYSVCGIFQARILEWVDISYSRGSFWSRDPTHISYISCIGSWVLTTSATWEALYSFCCWSNKSKFLNLLGFGIDGDLIKIYLPWEFKSEKTYQLYFNSSRAT